VRALRPLILLVALACFAGDRPACNAKMFGETWPPAANSDSRLLNELARRGELQICTRGAWRYRWTSPTVHINQLLKRRGDQFQSSSTESHSSFRKAEGTSTPSAE
jgi:hypothetical protein